MATGGFSFGSFWSSAYSVVSSAVSSAYSAVSSGISQAASSTYGAVTDVIGYAKSGGNFVSNAADKIGEKVGDAVFDIVPGSAAVKSPVAEFAENVVAGGIKGALVSGVLGGATSALYGGKFVAGAIAGAKSGWLPGAYNEVMDYLSPRFTETLATGFQKGGASYELATGLSTGLVRGLGVAGASSLTGASTTFAAGLGALYGGATGLNAYQNVLNPGTSMWDTLLGAASSPRGLQTIGMTAASMIRSPQQAGATPFPEPVKQDIAQNPRTESTPATTATAAPKVIRDKQTDITLLGAGLDLTFQPSLNPGYEVPVTLTPEKMQKRRLSFAGRTMGVQAAYA